MSDPNRLLPPFLNMPTHSQGVKACLVCTENIVSTASLGDGHYVVTVINQPESPVGAVAIFSREEVRAHIALLQLALDDADRLYAGKPALAALATATIQ